MKCVKEAQFSWPLMWAERSGPSPDSSNLLKGHLEE